MLIEEPSLPEFRCIPGCTDCCGKKWHVVAMIGQAAEDTELICEPIEKPDVICDALTSDGCSIRGTEQKPLICRLFGCVEGWEYPRGVKAQGKLLIQEHAKELLWQEWRRREHAN